MTEHKHSGLATAKQRQMLKIAIARDLLSPNPFSGQHEKWEKLTEGEAEGLLASIPPERLNVLEKDVREKTLNREHRLAHRIGREVENIVHEIGRTIDGGF